MNSELRQNITSLYKSWAAENPIKIIPLKISGSNRKYYRISGRTGSAVAAFNSDQKENSAFVTFAKHFFSKGLRVPQILAEDLQNNLYLLEDLGNQTLFELLQQNGFDEVVENYYKQALSILPKFQIDAGGDVDYAVCYPRDQFDKQSILWDLNYFKYYFLKLAGIQFDEQKLENDFHSFSEYLMQANTEHFMYRDFQSRNIMIKEGELFFIDFQGGRRGALQYDVASLLWSARANIPFEKREELLEYYLNEVQSYVIVDKTEFKKYYFGYVLIRILQTLGAYGYRGFYERKDHFLKSIPFAIDNLEWLIENEKLNFSADELFYVIARLIKSNLRTMFSDSKSKNLKITVASFSYKNGIPYDVSGNGGGFVFDCRALHNPGRYNEYKMLTGKDEDVINFLEEKSDVEKFLNEAKKLVNRSVANYQERNFTNLMVNFGCTGGQHRSVYCAERMANYLSLKPNLTVELIHTELEKRDDL